MKRTKTFVMKFLSVFILGAAVLATSCTKDLEDRMDKVEETLATVVKNVADLEAKLNALPKVGDIKLTASNVGGKHVLTFKVPGQADQVIEMDMTVDTNTDTNDAAEVIVIDNADNTTTIKIKQPAGSTPAYKEFTYQKALLSTISSIVALTADHTATAGTTFDVNFFFNTVDGKAVDLATLKGSISVINAYATKSAIEVAENVTVNAVTAVEGSTNEFVVSFMTVAQETAKSYRIGVKQVSNTTYSEPFAVTVGAAPIVTNMYLGELAIVDPSATGAAAEMGGVLTPLLGRSNSITSPVIKGEEYFYQLSTVNAANRIGASSIIERTFEIYKAEAAATTAANALISVITAGATPTTFSVSATPADYAAISKKISDEAAKTTGSTLVRADDHLAITSVKGIVTVTPDYIKIPANSSKYYIVMKGKVAGGNNFIVAGLFEVNNAKAYDYTPKDATAPTFTSTLTDDASLVLSTGILNLLGTGKEYSVITGGKTNANGTDTYVDIYDSKGVKVNVGAKAGAISVADVRCNAQNWFEYSFKLEEGLQLVDGETYTVNVKHVYFKDATTEKFFIIKHTVVAAKPVASLALTATTGYAYDAATKALSLDSYKVFAANTKDLVAFSTNNAIDFTKLVLTAKGATKTVAPANYNVFYRVKTTNAAGETVFMDNLGKTEDLVYATTPTLPVTSYVVAEDEVISTTQSNVRLAMDKLYNVDIVVVYSDGNRETIAITAIYNTAKITGFKASAADANVVATLTKEISSTVAGASLDFSYVNNDTKPFFFATDKKTTALWIGEATPVDPYAFIKLINNKVDYVINPLTAAEKAKITKAGVALTESELTALVSLVGFPTNNAQDLNLTSASAVTVGKLTINASASGLLTGYVLTADVNQTLTVKVLDYYGRTAELTITVTIKK